MADKDQSERIEITMRRLNLFEASINKLTSYFDGPDGLWTRIGRIETGIKNMSENTATKRDIDRLKIWILVGVLTTILTIIGGLAGAFMYLVRPVLQDLIQGLIKAGG